MSELKIKGIVIEINEVKSGTSAKSGKDWTSREFAIKEEGQYGSEIIFQSFGDVNVQRLNAIKVGDEVEVSFNIKGESYNGKRYNKLQMWSIKVLTTTTKTDNTQPKPESKPAPQPGAKEPENLNTFENDDLPF